MDPKTAPRFKMTSLRGALMAKPQLLFGRPATPPTNSVFSWEDEKPVARQYVQIRITEQELGLGEANESLKTIKKLLVARLDSGPSINFLITLTKLKNVEAQRDHFMGVIGSLEHLQAEIDKPDIRFDWKGQCEEILGRAPLMFSVKDESCQPLEALKEQVRSQYQLV